MVQPSIILRSDELSSSELQRPDLEKAAQSLAGDQLPIRELRHPHGDVVLPVKGI